MDALLWGLRTFSVAVGLLAAGAIAALAVRHLPIDVGLSEKRTIAVAGSASVNVAPTAVQVSGAVTTSAKSAAEALDENNAIMARILEGLKADGIDRNQISTTGFSIAPQHPPLAGDRYSVNELVTTGYVVKNSINVELPADAYSGKLLDRIIRLGATNIDSVSFAVGDASKYLDQVRADAAIDAKSKAEVAAKALGLRLGRVVSIDRIELPDGYGPPRAYAARARSGQPIEIMAREQTFNASTTVIFELE